VTLCLSPRENLYAHVDRFPGGDGSERSVIGDYIISHRIVVNRAQWFLGVVWSRSCVSYPHTVVPVRVLTGLLHRRHVLLSNSCYWPVLTSRHPSNCCNRLYKLRRIIATNPIHSLRSVK